MRKNNSLPFTITVIVAALLAIFGGYLIGNWVIQIVIGNPEGETEMAGSGKRIIEEELINNEDKTENMSEETNLSTNSSQNNSKNNIEEKEFIVNNKNNKAKDVYAIQVGAFNKYNNALELKNELESKGYQVVITEGVPYKVQVGASNNRDKAENMEKEIEALGYNAFITH